MLLRQGPSKRQLPLKAYHQKVHILQVVEDVGLQQNREADALEPQKVTDIVGNTEDEKKDF